MFRKVVSGLCHKSGGLVLVAGAIGVLTAVEQFMSTRNTVAASKPMTRPLDPSCATQKPRVKISQTRSELGYVYWVVRESGENPNYALFDTWQEAMDEVNRRMQAVVRTTVQPLAKADLVTA